MPKLVSDKLTGFTRIERTPEEQLVIDNRKALNKARIEAEELVDKLTKQSEYFSELIKELEDAKENKINK